MLYRRTDSSGVSYYQSALLEQLGVPHAFSTRLGGVSSGPFASLNLGNPGGGCGVEDAPEHIEENYRRLQAAAGLGGRERCWVHQVHGAAVRAARAAEPFENGQPADALICDDAGRLVAVRVADCVPVLLAREDGRVVAAIHAGWRGVVAGVVSAAVAALCRSFAGSTAGQLTAAIGPCISGDAYEVGSEVLEQFAERLGPRAPIRRRVGDKGLVDLREAVRQQLVGSGLPPRQIDSTDRCTYGHADEFFSHRRDNGITGRLAALIGPV